jgi:hypothetical protein
LSSSKLAALLSDVVSRHNNIERTRASDTSDIVLRTLLQSPRSAARRPTRRASLGEDGTITGEKGTGIGVGPIEGTNTPELLGTGTGTGTGTGVVVGGSCPAIGIGWAQIGVESRPKQMLVVSPNRARDALKENALIK